MASLVQQIASKWREWIIAIVAVALVVVILIIGHQSFKATEKASFNEFNRRQLVMANEATDGIELFFETLAGSLRAMRRMPGVRQFNEAATRQVLLLEIHELADLGVNDLGVVDENGILMYSVLARQTEGEDFSEHEFFYEAKKMTSYDKPIIQFTELFNPGDTPQSILVALPIFEKEIFPADQSQTVAAEKFIGIVFCTLAFDSLIQKFIAQLKSSERGHVFLFDDDYQVIWAPDKRLIGQSILQETEDFPEFQEILFEMISGRTGTADFTFYSYDETKEAYVSQHSKNIIAYVPVIVGKIRWSLGVWAPKDDARKLIRAAYAKQLILIAIIVLIIIGGASHFLMISFRYSKTLEKEVEAKTDEFKQAHQRLLTVLDGLDALVYVTDMTTDEILFANKYVQDTFGQVEGRTCWQALQGSETGHCHYCDNNVLLDGEEQPAGVNVTEATNPVTGRWYEIHQRAIRWVDGRLVRLVIAADSTERREAEQALKESETKYRRILDEMEEGYFKVDLNGNLNFFNRALVKLYGYKEEELMGMNNRAYMSEEDARNVFESYNEVFRSQESGEVGYEIISKNGTRRYVESNFGLDKDTKGNIIGFSGILHDVTDRRRAEQEVKLTSEKLATLLESLPVVPYTCQADSDFGTTFVSNTIEQLTGYKPEEFTSDPHFWADRIHPNDRTRIFREMQQIFRLGSYSCEYSFQAADGSYKLFSDYPTVAENGCENCHTTHTAGGNQWLLHYYPEEDNCLVCHSGKVASSDIEAELTKKYIHSVQDNAGVHDAAEDFSSGEVPVHVECQDCHNPHQSNATAATTVNGVSGKTKAVTGWTVDGKVVNVASDMFEICFKCHADYSMITVYPVTRQIPQLNTRLEFEPDNPSYHPVEAKGKNTDVPSLLAPYNVDSRISCMDCHNNDNPNGPKGPHGSDIPYMLEKQYIMKDKTAESPTSYALCYKCHSRTSILNDESFKEHNLHIVDEKTPCAVCHDPHGVSLIQGTSSNNSNLINFDLNVVTPDSSGNLLFEDQGLFQGSCNLTCHRENHSPKTY